MTGPPGLTPPHLPLQDTSVLANLDLVQLHGLLARPEGNGIPAVQRLSTIRCCRDVDGGGPAPIAAVKPPPKEEPAPTQWQEPAPTQDKVQPAPAGGEVEAPGPKERLSKPEQVGVKPEPDLDPAQQPTANSAATAAAGRATQPTSLPAAAKKGAGTAAARKPRGKAAAVKEEDEQAPAPASSQPAARSRAGASDRRGGREGGGIV